MKDVDKLFKKDLSNYNEEYLKRTKENVENPAALVGPADSFYEMRVWQEKLLKQQGLKPEDELLDFGCGNLRAGIPLIKYLEVGNYTGADISLKALQDGHRRIHENNLETKKPLIIQNKDYKLEKLQNYEADYMLLQSVWTHFPPAKLKKHVEYMENYLKENATVIFTLGTRQNIKKPLPTHNGTGWIYNPEHVKKLLEENGYTMKKIETQHPNGLETFKIF